VRRRWFARGGKRQSGLRLGMLALCPGPRGLIWCRPDPRREDVGALQDLQIGFASCGAICSRTRGPFRPACARMSAPPRKSKSSRATTSVGDSLRSPRGDGALGRLHATVTIGAVRSAWQVAGTASRPACVGSALGWIRHPGGTTAKSGEPDRRWYRARHCFSSSPFIGCASRAGKSALSVSAILFWRGKVKESCAGFPLPERWNISRPPRLRAFRIGEV